MINNQFQMKQIIMKTLKYSAIFGSLVVGALATALCAADGGLTDQMVKDMLTKNYAEASASSSQLKLVLHSAEVGTPRKVTGQEASDYTIPSGTTVYPVRADYSQTLILGSKASTKEIEGYFLFYYQDQYHSWAYRQFPPGSKHKIRP